VHFLLTKIKHNQQNHCDVDIPQTDRVRAAAVVGEMPQAITPASSRCTSAHTSNRLHLPCMHDAFTSLCHLLAQLCCIYLLHQK